MKKVPNKNIDPVLVDIKRPDFNYEKSMHGDRLDLSRVPQVPKERVQRTTKKIVLGFSLTLIVILIIFAGNSFIQAKEAIRDTGSAITGNFKESINALRNFEPERAASYLKKNTDEIGTLNTFLNRGSSQTILGILGGIIPAFKGVGNLLGGVANLNMYFIKLSERLDDLERNGFSYFQHDGKAFISSLQNTRDLIQDILKESRSVKNATADLKNLSSVFSNLDKNLGNQYLQHSADLYQLQGFLDNILTLLNSDEKRHIAIIFQNPAEIRPGGGFIGSYADLTLDHGKMDSLDVRDIYDPDGWVSEKVIPPLPLQRTTRDWAARDANWFFDFPTSAKTVAHFLESSQFYKDRRTVFDGVIAVNINVLKTFLEVTGPVNLPEYNKTITAQNFLEEIQREVEAGKDKKAGEPKRILKVLTPIILDRLGVLDNTNRKNLMTTLQEHLVKKDIMFYAKDSKIESFLQYANVGGNIYNLPNNFWGSYVAVVNANIAGGKSDAYMQEDVNVKIDIGTNGSSLTDLTIVRTHTGNEEKDPWWRATNQDYIQVYANPASALISIKGNHWRNSSSGFDYKGNHYEENPDLKKQEDSAIFLNGYNTWVLGDKDKKVFATWFTVKAGESKTLALRYETSYANPDIVAPGSIYTFVFEKQSGVENSLTATISAPLGYKWVENGSAVYVYRNNSPDGRAQINLTLAK